DLPAGAGYYVGSVKINWNKVYNDTTGAIISHTGRSNPGTEFTALLADQKDAVLIQLGYRPFYNVSLSNLQTYRTISGIPTTTAWTPPWASQYTTKTVDTTYEYSGGSDGSFTYQDYANTEIVILQADGFRDKY
ncbi:MAG: hypothetical protein ACK6EB_12610, partial [Planctomyces sp.]